MAQEHWVTRQLACNAGKAFDMLITEVEKAIGHWNDSGGAPTYQAVQNVDMGFNRIEVQESGRLRAYIAHKPGNDFLTANCGRWNFIGHYDEIKHWYLAVRWDAAKEECQLMVATEPTVPMDDTTAEAFVRALLEPVLFPTSETT